MIYFLAIIVLSVLGAVADSFIKIAGQRSPAHLMWLGLGALFYVLSVPGWFFVMRKVPLSVVGALYAASTVLLLVGIGVVGFHERLSATEVLGVTLALMAIMVLRRLL
jgi:multidrug transporter EmrE-like cation transporter